MYVKLQQENTAFRRLNFVYIYIYICIYIHRGYGCSNEGVGRFKEGILTPVSTTSV